MGMTREERAQTTAALHAIQAELEVYKTLLFCFLVNTMANTGRMELLDDLVGQARFLVEKRMPTGISAQEAEYQRRMTLLAFDRVLEGLQQARAAMERVENPNVN